MGVHGWLLAGAGVTYGDEMMDDIPLETQGKVCTASQDTHTHTHTLFIRFALCLSLKASFC